MPSSSQKSDLASSLSKLSIDSSNKKPAAKKTKEPVADSWEDEDVDDDEEEEEEEEKDDDDDKEEREGTATPQADGAKAPPPTPISPTYSAADRSFSPYAAAVDPSAPFAPPAAAAAASGGTSGLRRPEKTDAVARRMIASALGVKVPRMTEEQRAYDRAVKEKERKRREEEKAAEKRRLEAAEKAKAAIWED